MNNILSQIHNDPTTTLLEKYLDISVYMNNIIHNFMIDHNYNTGDFLIKLIIDKKLM